MALAELLSRLAAGVGFLLFGINDLIVDCIFLARRGWRAVTVYSRYPRAFANQLPLSDAAGLPAVTLAGDF